ncbi:MULTISPECIES: MarR family transcriptional regulator [Solirubrobacterales]|uniref:MarR family transcriptional regulator n=1 Tax=Solirubrobacterales TaxID=588673 RepID=UPI001E603B52|nr:MULTISPECIES: MarR family transcriptional regulator [Solirubrobacterales]
MIARTARWLRHAGAEEVTLLGPTLTAALATVERHGPLAPSELADRERIRRPSATRIVAKLEEHDLVTRTPDPADGRSCRVAITEPGRDHLQAIRSRKDAVLARRLAELSAEDRATLDRAADILERLVDRR